jgi:hypothetical protein
VQSDSSNVGLGAFLHQLEDDERLPVISFASRILKEPERNYYATELEALARLACGQKIHDQNRLQSPHLLTQKSPFNRPCFFNSLFSNLNTVRVGQTLSLMPYPEIRMISIS